MSVAVRVAAYATLIALLGAYAGLTSVGILHQQPAGIDFMPLWTAAREAFVHPERIYDFSYITQAQSGLLPGLHPTERPFVYPPTALLVFAPFAFLPFGLANILWVGVTGLAAGLAAWVAIPERRLFAVGLLLAAPAVWLSAVTGQTTFLITALLVLGIYFLKSRPWLAGVLLGLAATIKPNLLVLAPFCLLAGRHYRPLIASLVTGASLGLLSVLIFGLSSWWAWIDAIGRFQTLVMGREAFLRIMITPTAAAVSLGLPALAVHAIHALFAVAGLALGMWAFHKTEDWPPRLIALVCGGLMAGSYALFYDATLVGPAGAAIAAATFTGSRWAYGLIVYLLFALASEASLAPYVLVVLAALIASAMALGERPGWAAAPAQRPGE